MKYIICCFLIFSTFYCFSMPENFIVNIYDKGKFDKIVGSINVSGTNMYFTNADYRMFPLESKKVYNIGLCLNKSHKVEYFFADGDYDVKRFNREYFHAEWYDVKFFSMERELSLDECIKDFDVRFTVSFCMEEKTSAIDVPDKKIRNLFLFYTDKENEDNLALEGELNTTISSHDYQKSIYKNVRILPEDTKNPLYVLLAMSTNNEVLRNIDYKNKSLATIMGCNGFYTEGFIFNFEYEVKNLLGFHDGVVSSKDEYLLNNKPAAYNFQPRTGKEACMYIGEVIRKYGLRFYQRGGGGIDYPLFVYLSYDNSKNMYLLPDSGVPLYAEFSYTMQDRRKNVIVYAFLHQNESHKENMFSFYIFSPEDNTSSKNERRKEIEGASFSDVESEIMRKVGITKFD